MPRTDIICDASKFFSGSKNEIVFYEIKYNRIFYKNRTFFDITIMYYVNGWQSKFSHCWRCMNKTMIIVPSSQLVPFHCGVHMHTYAPAVLLHVPPFKQGGDVVHSSTSDKQHMFIFVMSFVYLDGMGARICYRHNELGIQYWIKRRVRFLVMLTLKKGHHISRVNYPIPNRNYCLSAIRFGSILCSQYFSVN